VKPTPDLLFLSQEDVVAAGGLDMAGCMETIAETLALHQRGETVAPPKSAIHWSDDLDTDERRGRIMAMPAYVGGSTRMAGLKWIPSVPANPSRGLPRGIGLIVLSDPETGLPVAVMDGTVVSAMRTGAVSGIAARLLAPPGARVASLIGAGVQARTQLAALELALPDLCEIRLYDVDVAKAERFAAEHPSSALRVVRSPEEAVRGAQVVVPATMAADPFIPAEWLEAGSLLLSVSSLDIEVGVIATADLVVTDDMEHETAHRARPLARAEAAGVLDRETVVPLGAIIAGDHPGRTHPEHRIVVSPVGMGIEDVAEGTRVYRRARAAGLGTAQRLWNEPIWR
jgi:ornithine cyclodeaminase